MCFKPAANPVLCLDHNGRSQFLKSFSLTLTSVLLLMATGFAFAAPVPTVSVTNGNQAPDFPAGDLVGEPFCFDANFTNTGPDAGFAPYLQITLEPELTLASASFATITQSINNEGVIGPVTDSVTGEVINTPVGATLYTITYPVGSVTNGSPVLAMNMCIDVDPAAAVDVLISDAMTITPGLVFGDSPTGANGAITGTTITRDFTPRIITYDIDNMTPEDERPPGPAWAWDIEACANIASDRSVAPIDFAPVEPIILPPNVQFQGPITFSGGSGCTAITTPADLTLAPGGSIDLNCTSAAGVIGNNSEVCFTFPVYITDTLDPMTCDSIGALNEAEHVSIQKGNSGSNRPGGTRDYTINIQVDEFIPGISRLEITDVFPDGLTFNDDAVLNFAGSSINLTGADRSISNNTPGAGETTVVFFVTNAVGSDLAAASSGTLDYSVTIDQNYSTPGTPPLLARDVLTNILDSIYDVADDPAAVPPIVGATGCTENSESTFEIVDITVNKETITVGEVQPGDLVQYRLTMGIPSGDTNNVVFSDFLPLPVFDAATVSTNTVLASNPNLTLGPADTLGVDPTSITIDAGNNAVLIAWPNISTATPQVLQVDLFVEISNEPFADDLELSNLFQAETDNTPVDSDVELTIDFITVRAPDLSIEKDVVGSDNGLMAGETVNYTIAITNDSVAEAYDVIVSDNVPAGLNNCILNSVVGGAGVAGDSPFDADGFAFTSFAAPTANALDGLATATLNVSCDINDDVTPSFSIVNEAAVGWASEVGGMRFPDIVDDASITTEAQPRPFKTIAQTSEAVTPESRRRPLATGEIIRFRMWVEILEGSISNVRLRDFMPPGLQFLNDGTAMIAFVSDAAGAITATSLDQADCGAGTLETFGAVADITPDCVLPAFAGVFGSGTDVFLSLGNVVNSELDANEEYILLELNAVNIGNQTNNRNRNNSFRIESTEAGNSNLSTAGVKFVLPELVLTKTGSPNNVDAGDIVTYTVTIEHDTTSLADAFDIAFVDILDDTYLDNFTFLSGPVAPAGETCTAGNVVADTTDPFDTDSSGAGIDITFDSLPLTEVCEITYSARVRTTVTPGTDIDNNATTDYDCLAGSGEAGNATGSPQGADCELSENDIATVDVQVVENQKSIVSTSLAHTTEGGSGASAGTPRILSIGETIRYRLEVRLPEGMAPDFIVTDSLPTGLQFTAGTERIAFVAEGAGISASPAITCGGGTLNMAGDDTTLASITPDCSINATGGPFASGTDPVFNLGDLMNDDMDADQEFVVIEFDALVLNELSNQEGVDLDNTFTVSIDGSNIGTTNTVFSEVVEPQLMCAVNAIPNPLDNLTNTMPTVSLTYTLTNGGGATAFQAGAGGANNFVIDLPAGLENIANLVVTPTGSVLLNNTTTPVAAGNFAVSGANNNVLTASNLLQFDSSASLQITFDAALQGAVVPGATLNDICEIAYRGQVSGGDANGVRDETDLSVGDSGNDPITDNTDVNDYRDEAPLALATIDDEPEIGLAKQLTSGPTTVSKGVHDITYTLVVENSGNVGLDTVQVLDDLSTTFSAASAFAVQSTTVTSTSSTLTAATPAYTGTGANTALLDAGNSTLGVGEFGTITVTVRVTPGSTLGPYNNTATSSAGSDQSTDTTNDTSDDGSNPDGNGDDDPSNDSDPTPVTFPPIPEIGLAKTVSTAPTTTGNGVYSLVYSLFVENSGGVVLNNIQLVDDLSATFGSTPFNVTGTTVSSTSGTLVASGNPYDGSTGAGANLLNAAGSSLGIGESGTITISVDVTPGSALGPYSNTATTNANSTSGPVNDTSDDGTDPDGDGDGEPEDDSDPTPVSFTEDPEIGLAKTVSSAPTTTGNGVYSFTYTLLVENSGDVDLDNLQVVDDLDAVFGSTPFTVTGTTVNSTSNTLVPSTTPYDGSAGAGANLLDTTLSTLAVGEVGTITISVDVTPGSDLGPYNNTATTSGESPAGGSVNDTSDDGSNPDGNGDDDPTNDSDQTPVSFTEDPGIGIAKTISAGPTTTGNGIYTLTYTLFVENTGDVDLSDVDVDDELSTTFANATSFSVTNTTVTSTSGTLVRNAAYTGTGANLGLLDFANSTLPTGEVGTITITVDVTPGSDLGPYDNTATARGDSPGTETVDDDSDDGTDPDGDGDGSAANDDDPTPVTFTEDPELGLAKVISTAPTTTGNGVYSFVYTLFVENSGDVDLDDVQVIDDLAATFANATSFNVTATTVTSTNGTLVASPTPYDGTAGAGANLLDATSSTLAVGEAGTITISVDLTPGSDLGPYNNTATTSGDSPSGNTVNDTSDQGTAPDGNGDDDPTNDSDPTPISFVEGPMIGLAKTISAAPTTTGNGVYSMTYTLFVENSGDVDLDNVQLIDDLATTFAGATSFSVTGTTLTSTSGTLVASTTPYDGTAGAGANLFDASTSTLAVGESGTVTISVDVTPGSDLGPYDNSATTSGDSPADVTVNDTSDDGTAPDGDGDTDPTNDSDPTTVTFTEAPEIGLAKTISTAPTTTGDGVYSLVYTLFVENSGDVDLDNVQIVDDLAATFAGASFNVTATTVTSTSGTLVASATPYNGNAGPGANLVDAATSTLAVGEAGTITISVDVTPGSNLGPYDNSATASGDSPADDPVSDNSDDGTVPDGNGDGDPGNDGDDTPVTFSEAPEIGLAKTISTLPTTTGNGVYSMTYMLFVENSGDVDLDNVQIVDDLSVTFAGATFNVTGSTVTSTNATLVASTVPYDGTTGGGANLLDATSTLAVGEAGTITISVDVTPGTNLGPYNNTATSSGDSPADVPVTDDSDNGTAPDGDGNGDPSDDDDPTPITFTEAPGIGLAKTISNGPTNNTDGTYTLTYTFTVENTGDVDLANLQLSDDLTNTFGTVTYTIDLLASNDFSVNSGGYTGAAPNNTLLDGTDTLLVNGSGTVDLTITITPGADFGPFSNTANVTGTSPGGATPDDDSDDGVTPDGDGDGDPSNDSDPTTFGVSEAPEIGLAKQLSTGPINNGDGTYSLAYTFVVENSGNVDLSAIQVTDSLATTYLNAGYVIDSLTSTDFTVSTTYDGDADIDLLATGNTLGDGDTGTIELAITVTPGTNVGPYDNTADASGTSPAGAGVDDISDDGTDPDGDGDNDPSNDSDPTPFEIPPQEIGIAKEVTSFTNIAGAEYLVEFSLVVSNLSATEIATFVQVTDDLSVTFPGVASFAVVAGSLNTGALIVNPNYDGSTDINLLAGSVPLAVGQSETITFQVQVDFATATGPFFNQAEVTSSYTNGGDPVSNDLSDSGDDPDGSNDGEPGDSGGSDDPTPINIPNHTLVKAASTPVNVSGPIYDVTYTMTVTNTGSIPLTNIAVSDALVAALAPSTLVTPPVLTISGFTGPGSVNAAYDGDTNIDLLSGDVQLPASGGVGVITIDVRFSNADGATGRTNIASSMTDQNPVPVDDEAEIEVICADSDGDGATDCEEGTGDRDGDGIPDFQDFDPMGFFYCEDNGQILTGGRVEIRAPDGSITSNIGTANGITLTEDGSDGFYRFFYDGTPGIYEIIIAQLPTIGIPSTARLSGPVIDASTFTTNPAILGSGENGTTGFLTDFSAATNTPFYLQIDFEAGDPDVLLNNIPMTACAGDENSIILGKSVSDDEVVVGDFASYTLSLTNTESYFLTDVTVTDLIPPGFTYVEGSAMLESAGAQTPITVTGSRPITFEVGRIESGEEVLITYLLRVGAGVVQGVYPNTAQAMIREDIGSNVATAQVEVVGDPLINNTRIIGKVWHDRDQDGWQDSADATDVSIGSDAFGWNSHKVGLIPGRLSVNDPIENYQVTVPMPYRPSGDNSFRVKTGEGAVIFVDNDGKATVERQPDQKNGQDIRVTTELSGKGSDLKGSRRINRYLEKRVLNITITNHGIHEEGVAGARLATVDGLLIETDQYGRYHIEDIDDVRWDTGSNYIVKVDPASLPDETIFTTENPRVERLTQSLMTDINFGVVLPAQTVAAAVPMVRNEKVMRERTVSKTVTEARASEVRFASGKHAISASQIDTLKQRLEALRGKKNLRIRFAGHTDNEPLSPATAAKYGDNQGLSEARAKIVADAVLESLGQTDLPIETIGFGDTEPLAANTSAAGMNQNRRVEIDILYDEESVEQVEELVEQQVTISDGVASGGVIRAVDDQSLTDPRLAMAADYNTVSTNDGIIGVHVYTNYPAYIENLMLEVFAGHDHDLINPIQQTETLVRHDLDVMHSIDWNVSKLEAGASYQYRVIAKGKDNKTDVTTVRSIQVMSQDKITEQREPQDPARIYGANHLDKQRIAVHGGRVRILGQHIDPEYAVTVAGEAMLVDDDGAFILEAHMSAGNYTVPVVMTDVDGNISKRELPITITDKYLFMVGLANVTFGSNDIGGSIEPLSADDRYADDSYTSGRLAFYLKGKIKGKYLVTAQLDTTDDDLDNIGDNLKAKDPTSIFRRLEDDQYYPVYGDDSTTRSDTDSQGAMYVRVEWDKSQALWGNFTSGITANEFAQYNRSLYGAQLVYQRPDYTKYNDHRLSAELFVSEPQTVAGHNEFVATGGSLYYLSQTDVVRGSERLSVEVRRRGSQQVVESIPLEAGKDYQFDHFQGRIILNRPLSQVSRDHFANIIKDDPLEGDDVFLLADFEYVSTGFNANDITVGGHANAWVTDALGIGATYVNEARSGADYELKGLDLTLRAGLATYVKLEVAESDSVLASSFLSSDGGISFQPQKLLGANVSGRAYGLEAQANLAEITQSGEGTIRAWYKEREAGFSSTRESAEATDVTDIGIEANVLFGEALDFIARANRVERDGQSETTLLSVQGNYKLNDRLTVAVEGRYDELSDQTGLGLSHEAILFGARAAYALSDISEVYLEGQVVVDDSGNYADNQLLTVGWYNKFSERLGLGAEVSTGDRGDAYTGIIDWSINDRVSINLESGFGSGAMSTAGLSFNVSQDHQIYGSYGIDPDKVLGRNQYVSTIGQRKKFGNRLTIFNEHQWLEGPEENAITDVFGIDIALRDKWLLTLSLQGSETENTNITGSSLERQAATIGLSYQGVDTRFGSTLEYRVDRGVVQDLEQYLSTNSIEHKFNESWRALAKLNWSETKDQLNGGVAAQFTEANIGLAYRPVNHNRLNMLSKYTYLYDLVSPDQLVNRPDQRSHVLSLEALYDISRRWEIGLKLAARRGEVRVNRDQGLWFENGVNLAVIRARYHMTHKWDGVLDYRILQTVGVDDERHGALAALYRHIGKNAKVGIGYNFTDYSDDLTNLDYDANGFFLDIVGKW